MKTLLRLALLVLLCASCAHATTYYIAASGADTNNGTSISTPWLHAPGMSTCTSLCASTTINAGDSIIFRGGDTWHGGNSGLTPFFGFGNNVWNFTRSGTSSNCNFNPSSAIVTTSCIYIGVDQTWFTGASWVRPQFHFDNPITTTSPASCSFNDYGIDPINISGSYVIVDNLEFLGFCNGTSTGGGLYHIVTIAANDEIQNSYWHGWTATTAVTSTCSARDCDELWFINTNGNLSVYTRVNNNAFDGTDSTYGNTVNTGPAVGPVMQGGGEFDHNYIAHVSNIVKTSPVWSFHDNYGTEVWESPDGGTHGNWFELFAAGWTIDTYVYNNILTKNWSIGETYDVYPGGSIPGKAGFFFNNVTNSDKTNLGGNCFLMEAHDAQGTGPEYIFNNVFTSGCITRTTGTGSNTGIFQNGQFVGYSGCPSAGVSCAISNFSSLATNTDNGNQVWQTTATANTQGYTVANNWAPQTGTNSTVGAGANLTSVCNIMDNAAAKAACSLGLPATGPITYNATTHTVTTNAGIARGSTWDVGPYQFGGSVATPSFSPPAGTYATTQTVSLSTLTSGASICYTTDSTIPTELANVCTGGTTQTYSTALTVSSNQTIKALGTKSGLTDSSVVSANYVIGVVPVAPSLLMLQVN